MSFQFKNGDQLSKRIDAFQNSSLGVALGSKPVIPKSQYHQIKFPRVPVKDIEKSKVKLERKVERRLRKMNSGAEQDPRRKRRGLE